MPKKLEATANNPFLVVSGKDLFCLEAGELVWIIVPDNNPFSTAEPDVKRGTFLRAETKKDEWRNYQHEVAIVLTSLGELQVGFVHMTYPCEKFRGRRFVTSSGGPWKVVQKAYECQVEQEWENKLGPKRRNDGRTLIESINKFTRLLKTAIRETQKAEARKELNSAKRKK